MTLLALHLEEPDNFRLDWEFDVAEGGNIALIGELDRAGSATTWEPNAPSWV